MINSPLPTENYNGYLECIREAIQQPPTLWSFKRDARYRVILEHTTPSEAVLSYQCADEALPHLDLHPLMAQYAVENDTFGNPITAYLENYNLQCDPSNGRYFWHAVVLLQYLQSKHLDNVNVVELGAGFGGLAFYVRRLQHLFNVHLDTYTMVDVDVASILQNQYMEATNTEATSINGLDGSLLKSVANQSGCNVLFSAYAFSEFDADMRQWYVNNLVHSCRHGFIVWNMTDGFYNPSVSSKRLGGNVYQFVPYELSIEPERPLIRPDELFVSW